MTAEAVRLPVRVLLVDDHQLLVHSLAVALRAEGLEADLADLTDRAALLRRVRVDPPDLVLLDLDLGGVIQDGATLIKPFRDAGTRVLVVSACGDVAWLGAAVEQGAIGLISKSGPFDELLSTVLRAAHGDDVMPAQERHRVMREVRVAREHDVREREPFERLTDREQQVLQGLMEGTPVGRIAEQWFVSEATVRSQVRAVLTKLQVKSQLEAVAAAHRTGWPWHDTSQGH